MAIFKYDTGIYPVKLAVAIDATAKDLNNVFLFDEGIIITTELHGYDALLFPKAVEKKSKNFYSILYVSKKHIRPALIAHEAYHYAQRLFEYIEEKDTCREPMAYLIEWAVDKVYESLEQLNKVKK